MTKVLIVRAFDHFSTDDRSESEVVAEFVGVPMGEDERYIYLRHCKADIFNSQSAEEIHKIMKCAIKETIELTT